MPVLILIKGPAGAGKSTTCKELLKRRDDLEFVDLESLKEEFSHLAREERKKQAHTKYYPLVKQLLKKEKNILLQESFLQDITKELGRELAEAKYRVYSFFLEVSLEECKQRNNRRKKQLSEEYLEKSYTYLAIPEEGDQVLDAETNSVEAVVSTILTLLKKS